jgi:autotransporter-associated beta strand protein
MSLTRRATCRASSAVIARAALFALALAVAITGQSASAATYTWRNLGIDFNDAANWNTTVPVAGDYGVFSGSATVQPALTASSTVAGLTFSSGTNYTLSGAAHTLTLTALGTVSGSAALNFTGSPVNNTISTNLFLAATSGTQGFNSINGTHTISGTISGGNAAARLWIGGGVSTRFLVLSNTANSFASQVMLNGLTTRVASIGSMGFNSSLGTNGTIEYSANAALEYTGSGETSDKNFVLSGVANQTGAITNTGGGLLTLTGSMVSASAGAKTLALGSGSITASGLISDGTGGSLGVRATSPVTLTNQNNSFSGGVRIRGSTLSTAQIGMTGFNSTLGTSGTISFGNTGDTGATQTLNYTGPGETSDKRLVFLVSGNDAINTISQNGSGTLTLSNTAAILHVDAVQRVTAFTLSGSGNGVFAGVIGNINESGTANTRFTKSGSGTWTLTGANTYSGTTAIQAGTLLFAKRASLYNGGTANWTQALINTSTNGAATLGLGVGGTDGFTNADFTTLLANLGTGSLSTGGMRFTSSWGFDTTNTGSTFAIDNAIANTAGTGGGAIGVAKLGSGTLSLGGNNTFTYGTRIDGGTLLLGHANALGTGTAFVRINGGTLDLGGLSVNRDGPITATAGSLVNGVLAGTASLTKTGTGTFTITTGSSTFTGATNIQEGVVEVAVLSGSGVAGSLGAPTLNSTINLGNGATAGTLRFVGSSSGSSNRPIQLTGSTGGGMIEANGSVPLVLTGSIGAANGTKTLTLSGTSVQDNTIGAITKPTLGVLSVVKDGSGLWWLTGTSDFNGGLTVRNGTVVAAANDGSLPSTSGVFGVDTGVTVGDTAANATGTAALLAAANATIRREITASGTGVGQVVLIGGASNSGTSTFNSTAKLMLGRDVALVATGGGAVTFENQWFAASGSGTPTANVAIGADGFTGAVRLLTSGTLATGGSIGVRYGTAVLGSTTTLDGAGTLSIDAGATLAGIGTVAGPLGGAGIVAPGNSPGILTAEAFDASGGLGAAFEFSGTAAPNYASASNSLNDVLRLTGTSPFLSSTLGSGNVVNVYLPSGVTAGDVFLGGFFADNGSDFTTLIQGATYNYWVAGSGTHVYNSGTYAPLGLTVTVGTTPQSGGTFANGDPVNGTVSTFTVVVPEPATITLAALGVAIAARTLRRRRPG